MCIRDRSGKAQYEERWKYFKNPEYEPNNYYHHYGTGWNWDLPNRWWGQIAGDCVDLNTENDYVADYIVKCYGKFIEMGVDAFRIDTTGCLLYTSAPAGVAWLRMFWSRTKRGLR